MARRTGRILRPLKALTAAAAAATSEGSKNIKPLHQPWQRRAFGYYKSMGECWNPAQFYSRAMSKLTVFAGTRDENGDIEPAEGAAQELIDQIQGVSGGQAAVLASNGLLLFLVGEGRLCQSRPPEKEGGTMDELPIWEFLSPTEIALTNNGRTIIRSQGEGAEKIEYVNLTNIEGAGDPEPGQMRMWRLWRRDPEYSALADSPVRGVLDLYEQLWWVTMGERSDLQSRIANAGILLIPEEIEFEAPGAEEAATAEDPEADPFTRVLGEAMMTAIGNPGSASAVVPPIVRAPAEFLKPEVLRHLQMHDPMTSLMVGSREEALIRRISIGLDLPVEEVMGLSMANHWTAWKLDEEKWAYVEPIIQMFCDDLGAAYLRPMARAQGITNWADLVVGYDNTDLVTDPDKGKTAIQLHKQGAVSNQALRSANGFSDDDAPSEEEHAEWLAIQLRDPSIAGFETEEPGGEEDNPPDEDTGEQEPPDEEDMPDELATAGNGGVPIEAVYRFAHNRAREVLGSRLRSKSRTCPECLEGLSSVKNRRLIEALGPELVERLGVSTREAAQLMATTFVETLGRLQVPMRPEALLIVERHYAQTLYQPTVIEQELIEPPEIHDKRGTK